MSPYEPPMDSGLKYGQAQHLAAPEPTSRRRRVWVWIVWPVSVVAAFVAGLGIGITFQPDEAVAAEGASAAEPSATAVDSPDSVPHLEIAKDLCADTSPHVVLGDGGDSVSISTAGKEHDGASIEELACVLTEIDTPESVIARMDNTRALDGTLEASWEEFYATWNYHPDSGVNMVIEVRETP